MGQRPARAPYKGLTDHPAYQWWRDPTIMQPESWWGADRTEADLRGESAVLRGLGVRLFRVELPWWAVAPDRPGGQRYDAEAARDPAWRGYQWERCDLIVRVASDAGLALVPQVVYAPEWSMGAPAAGHGAAPPGDAGHYADLMTALARRYGGRVRYWELWNEPDHPHTWSGTLADYVALVLRPGASALRAADPKATVVLGGLVDARNLAAIYAAGGGEWFDIASVHAYPRWPGLAGARRVAWRLRRARAIMRAHGDGAKPLWLTEFGAATRASEPPDGRDHLTSPRGQARFIRGVYQGTDADAVFFYQLRDAVIRDANGRALKRVYWGIMSGDAEERKPGFDALRALPSPPLGGERGSYSQRGREEWRSEEEGG